MPEQDKNRVQTLGGWVWVCLSMQARACACIYVGVGGLLLLFIRPLCCREQSSQSIKCAMLGTNISKPPFTVHRRNNFPSKKLSRLLGCSVSYLSPPGSPVNIAGGLPAYRSAIEAQVGEVYLFTYVLLGHILAFQCYALLLKGRKIFSGQRAKLRAPVPQRILVK